jgi:hypothetical protein
MIDGQHRGGLVHQAERSRVCHAASGFFSGSHPRTLDMGHAADRVRGDRILCAIVEAIGLARYLLNLRD